MFQNGQSNVGNDWRMRKKAQDSTPHGESSSFDGGKEALKFKNVTEKYPKEFLSLVTTIIASKKSSLLRNLSHKKEEK